MVAILMITTEVNWRFVMSKQRLMHSQDERHQYLNDFGDVLASAYNERGISKRVTDDGVEYVLAVKNNAVKSGGSNQAYLKAANLDA